MRVHAIGLITVLSLFRSQGIAADAIFDNCKLSYPDDLTETPVSLTVGDSVLVIRPKSPGAADIAAPYSSIERIAYSFTNRRRVEGVVVAPVLALTKAQNHWLVIQRTGAPAPPELVLRVDKKDHQGIVAALNAKSGKRVEVLDPESAAVDPTIGSKDVDELLAYPPDRMAAALVAAMQNFRCKVRVEKNGKVECSRNLGNSGRVGVGGERVVAEWAPEGAGTRLRIRTVKGMGRNWSAPILRVARRHLAPPAQP